MKFIKTLVLASALISVTSASADNRGNEELCHDVAEADVSVKHVFQEDPSVFKDFLERINKDEKNPKTKAGLRERLYWVYNNKDLSDSLLWKLSYLRCSARM